MSSSNDTPQPERLTYREKRERKAERLREWADKREDRAAASFEQSHALADQIPFGQPILVGHHSEKGHRRHLGRIESTMRAAVENSAKASEMAQRADEIERQAKQAIYNDDPDATERLAEKVAKLERQREAMKAANVKYRAEHKAELKAMTPFERSRAVPFPNYTLTNLGATIRNAQQRLDSLSAPERPRMLSARYVGECRKCGESIDVGETIAYYKRSRDVECEGCAS